jgi:hypothetical protein
VREETITIGRVLAMVAVAAVSIALLFTSPAAANLDAARLFAAIVLPLLGVAGSVGLLFPLLRGPSATSRATMLTPVVLLALGPFQLSFSVSGIAQSVSYAAAYAGVGLVVGALQESRRSAVAIVGLMLAVAVLSTL